MATTNGSVEHTNTTGGGILYSGHSIAGVNDYTAAWITMSLLMFILITMILAYTVYKKK